MVSKSTEQKNYIRDQFTKQFESAGFELIDRNVVRGYETVRFQKIVNHKYLFCSHLCFESRLIQGQKSFGVCSGVELIAGLQERKPWLKTYADLEEAFCTFHFGSLLELEQMDSKLARKQRESKWMLPTTWKLGQNMIETVCISKEAINFEFAWIAKYEQLFVFPAPLDLITIDSLTALRDFGIYTDLLRCIGGHNPKGIAETLVTFYTQMGEEAQAAIFRDFIHGKETAC
ncbi:MAG: hypothetical protein C0508_00185 [Cyanobacteria bacterium PR.023]|nr:hypothetical protein [Cyanobacteria bacterium PR.023]